MITIDVSSQKFKLSTNLLLMKIKMILVITDGYGPYSFQIIVNCTNFHFEYLSLLYNIYIAVTTAV